MKGKVIPVGGMRFIAEPILIKACIHIKKQRLKTVFDKNKFEKLYEDLLVNTKNRGYKNATKIPKIRPNSSIKIAKIKSLCDSGMEYFN